MTDARLKFIGLAALILAGLTACNTVEGLGEDVEAAGEAVQEEADDAQN